MFGSILGTLQRFRADESKDKDRDLKKRKIEAKIDQKSEKEKEEAIRQKKELFEDKKKKEREIKVLQVNATALIVFGNQGFYFIQLNALVVSIICE